MKTKIFLSCFILLTLSSILTSIRAVEYEVGIEEENEFIWVCISVDVDAMEDLFSKDWDEDTFWEGYGQGARFKVLIKEVDRGVDLGDGLDRFCLKTDNWFWTTSDKWGSPDKEDETSYQFESPKDYTDYGADMLYSQPPLWLPIPVVEYLAEINFDGGLSAKENNITAEVKVGDFINIPEALPKEECKYILSYNDQGILSQALLKDKDDSLVTEFILQEIISGYNLPVLFGILTFLTIGIVYLTRKNLFRQ